jgi:glycosyltransferase involved in cell wall biosynthesis
VVFHTEDAPIDYIGSIGYKNICFIPFEPYPANKLFNFTNKVIRKLTGINIYYRLKYLHRIDVLYPYFEFMYGGFGKGKHGIHWLVDFNNRAFPDYYSDKGKDATDFQVALTSRPDHIVLSSYALLGELKHYYPGYRNKVSILRFACSLPDISAIDFASLQQKYQLHTDFFMSPNQFWEHKNQLVLIEALNIVKKAGKLNFKIVFTGSTKVHRGKGHILEKLLSLAKQYQLEENIVFLGLIDRNEQLVLMKNANALIQPSLYEGWSTLVEEAKALNQHIILSDLPVHREQNCLNSYFFDPHNPEELAQKIIYIMEKRPVPVQINYADNIHQFGADMLQVLNNELQKN